MNGSNVFPEAGALGVCDDSVTATLPKAAARSSAADVGTAAIALG